MTKDNLQKRNVEMLYSRYHDLLISQKFAQQQIGFIHTLDITYGEDFTARTLLEVEAIAHKKREKKENKNHQFIAQVNTELHQQIQQQIDDYLNDVDYIYQEIVQIQDNIPAVLDILAVKSASVGRIDTLVKDMLWLGEDILKLINLPQYRQEKDPKKVVKVDSPSLALRYIGLDNLKMIVPTFSLKHWTPHSTFPFKLLKRKLWENGMATAIAARGLAQKNEVDPYQAFVLGMFHDIGKLAVVRLYLRVFDSLWEKNTREARENGKKDLHTALSGLSPDPLFLRNLMAEKSAAVSLDLISRMSLKYLPITHAMSEIANKVPVKQASSLAQTVLKARAYSHYKFLQKHVLIEPDEAKSLFSYYQFTGTELKLLASMSLQNLQLRIER